MTIPAADLTIDEPSEADRLLGNGSAPAGLRAVSVASVDHQRVAEALEPALLDGRGRRDDRGRLGVVVGDDQLALDERSSSHHRGGLRRQAGVNTLVMRIGDHVAPNRDPGGVSCLKIAGSTPCKIIELPSRAAAALATTSGLPRD
jgi:hypothetical protein